MTFGDGYGQVNDRGTVRLNSGRLGRQDYWVSAAKFQQMQRDAAFERIALAVTFGICMVLFAVAVVGAQ